MIVLVHVALFNVNYFFNPACSALLSDECNVPYVRLCTSVLPKCYNPTLLVSQTVPFDESFFHYYYFRNISITVTVYT